jgi:hypothetical protein
MPQESSRFFDLFQGHIYVHIKEKLELFKFKFLNLYGYICKKAESFIGSVSGKMVRIGPDLDLQL